MQEKIVEAIRKFQSLIGRLKTNQGIRRLGICLWFQSLIGRLKTVGAGVADRLRQLFQSLIGRLKTRFRQI